jgi:hypothetical protein
MIKFPNTPKGKTDYLACLQKGKGYVANCCSGWPGGYKFHSASCTFLYGHKDRSPIMNARGTGKLWAATLSELEENAQTIQPGRSPSRCGYCLHAKVPEEYDTDMERESHLVIPGGQVESNRRRH